MENIKLVEKSWGHEEWLVNNELYCAKYLTCVKDLWSSNGLYHYHKLKDETFIILEGSIILDIEGTEYTLNDKDSFRIKPNTKHRFKALTHTAKILEISTTHRDEDSYRVS